MNMMIPLVMIAGWLGAMAFLFIPNFLWFLIGLFGFMLGIGPVLIITKLMAPRMYYYRFRIFEDRGSGAYVEKDLRGRKVTGKDNHEYLETPTGQRFRFSELKHFMAGTGGQLFGDFFRTAGQNNESQLSPMALQGKEKEVAEGKKKGKDKHESTGLPIPIDLSNIADIRLKTIPVDHRAWFSDNRVLGYIKEATKLPMDAKMQVLQTMTFVGAVLMVAIILLFYPTYVEEMTAYLNKDASQKAAVYQQLLDTINDNQPILCQYEITQPVPVPAPEPEPVPPPEAPPG